MNTRILRKYLNLDKLNILTFPTHESYQTCLSATGHEFYLYHADGIKVWEDKYRPLPKNHHRLNKAKSKAQIPVDVDFDLVLSQNKFGQYQIAVECAQMLNVPLISLEHTLPMPSWNLDTLTQLGNMRGHTNVFISEFSRAQWGMNDAEVIHHGIDTEFFKPTISERDSQILSVVNDWKNRDWCMPADQRILTSNGYVKIQDIKIGHKVLTDSGKYETVMQTFKNLYNGPMYNIYIDKNKIPISFTSNHGIRVFRNNQYKYVTASQIRVGDKLRFPKIIQQNYTFSDIDLSWLIGLILGDGSITVNGNITICLNQKESEIAEKAKNILQTIIGYASIKYITKKNKRYIIVQATSKIFGTWLKNEIGDKSYSKKIPDFIFFGNDDVKINCLLGLFDADGCITQNNKNSDRFIYNSISIKLASQFMALCHHFGIKCSFHKRKNRALKSNKLKTFIYSIVGYGKENVNNFNNLYSGVINKPYSYMVTSIECNEEWSGNVYNCKVNNNPSYVVNPGIVAHNCCGYDLWLETTRGLQVKPVGDTPGLSKLASSPEELVTLYNSHIFLNTSLISPVPTALLEAMSCGAPVVTTNTCMIPEIIEHGKNGFMANNPYELRYYLEMLLKDKALQKQLGQNARETIKNKFSLEQFTTKWNEVFWRTFYEN